MFSRDDLDQLAREQTVPAVSIFLPTHPAGREIRQDPVRLKNLIDQAAERLVEVGHRRPEVDALLAPASALIGEGAFWREQDRGLALFLAPSFFRRHATPIDLPEQVVVGRHFHLKPLLPLLSGEGAFLVLAASASGARLFEGTRFSFRELRDAGLPGGVPDVAGETDYADDLHASPVARPRSGAPGGIKKTHNFGESPEEQRKTQLIEYLHRLHAAVQDHPASAALPIVLAAQPEIDGNFRAIAQLPRLLPETVQANPDALDPDELHRRAYAVIEPAHSAEQARALDRFRMLDGSGDGKATTRAEEIVTAARDGRVDTLFVVAEEHLWGHFGAADRIVAHGTPTPEDDDLTDYAAVQTLLQGGRVSVMPKAELPRGGPMAAVLRY